MSWARDLTSPVECDASKRALVTPEQSQVLAADEMPGARKMLNAAALPHLAASVASLLQPVYWAMLLLGNRG